MPLTCYEPYNPRDAADRIIDQANDILEEYQEQGFKMTLRQLYYQFVARGLLANAQANYEKLIRIMSKARLGGLVDWDAIEDRTRDLVQNSHWDSPAQIIRACARQYQINKWAGQEYQPEVWVEKVALINVIEGPCGDLDIPFFACKGYNSQSEMWAAGMRLVRYIDEEDQIPVILHFGDHDPSGIQMTHDIDHRLRRFVGHHTGGHDIIVRRVALTMDQVEQYHPPNNVAKQTDSRYAEYAAIYGDNCWELDALPPPALVELVRTSVLEYRDATEWASRESQEREEKAQLQRISSHWTRVVNAIESGELDNDDDDPDLFDDVDDDEEDEDDED